MTEQTTAAATETETSPVQLNLNDLGAAIQVIDICSKRGAFEGAELADVGALRNRLVQFVQANAKPEDIQETAEATEEGTGAE